MPHDQEANETLEKLVNHLEKAERRLRKDGAHVDAADAVKRARRELALFAQPRGFSDTVGTVR